MKTIQKYRNTFKEEEKSGRAFFDKSGKNSFFSQNARRSFFSDKINTVQRLEKRDYPEGFVDDEDQMYQSPIQTKAGSLPTQSPSQRSAGSRSLALGIKQIQQNADFNLVQRDLAVEVANPDAEMPVLDAQIIQDAIAFNQRRIRRTDEISVIRDVIGISPEPAVIDEDFINHLAWYQAMHAISADGKLGRVTAARLSQEFRNEGRGLGRTEGRQLRRLGRRMGSRAMGIRVNNPASLNNNRGSGTFGVMWNIPDRRANGYVIQHVRFMGNVTNCAGNPVTSNNGSPPNDYYEAWRVVNGRVRCGNLTVACASSDDTFTTINEPSGTRGTVTVRGRASFFPDYRLSSTWVTTTGHPAGALPHRNTRPPEWSESEAKTHQMRIQYDSCATPNTSSVTSIPR